MPAGSNTTCICAKKFNTFQKTTNNFLQENLTQIKVYLFFIISESGTPNEQLFSRILIVSNTETVHPLLTKPPQNTMHRSPIKVRLMLFDFQPNRQLFLQLRKTMSMAAERMSKRRQKNSEDKRKIDEKELLDPVSFIMHTNQGSRKLFPIS